MADKRKHGKTVAGKTSKVVLNPKTGFRVGSIGDKVATALLTNSLKVRSDSAILAIIKRVRVAKGKDASDAAVIDAARTWRWLAAKQLDKLAKKAVRKSRAAVSTAPQYGDLKVQVPETVA